MNSENLPENVVRNIENRLPDILSLKKDIAPIHPDFITFKGIQHEYLAKAKTCLQDSIQRCIEIRYSLRMAFCKIEWYLTYHPEAPIQYYDVYFGKYYFDNAALRFYPAGEDLAQFIIEFLRIPENSISKIGQKKGKISKASKVGGYLSHQLPKHNVTKIVTQLLQNRDWEKIIKYRNGWVHEQPPIFKGEGMRFNRDKRWKNGVLIGKCGDGASCELDAMLDCALNAFRAFFNVIDQFKKILLVEIEKLGIKVKN